MCDAVRLELATLLTRHPAMGDALLHLCATPVIHRCSIDPVSVPGTMERAATADHLPPPGTGTASQTEAVIGWSDLPPEYTDVLLTQLPICTNAEDITERAAIGVMALLVSEIADGRLRAVLPIGSGGDYLVELERRTLQLELSGIRLDPVGAASRARLHEKAAQVLTHADAGYASVTTFALGAALVCHSYLRYVRRPSGKRKQTRKGKKR